MKPKRLRINWKKQEQKLKLNNHNRTLSLIHIWTQDQAGKLIPVVITVYSDKSFDFIIKQPPVAVQLLELAKVKKGSAEPHVLSLIHI